MKAPKVYPLSNSISERDLDFNKQWEGDSFDFSSKPNEKIKIESNGDYFFANGQKNNNLLQYNQSEVVKLRDGKSLVELIEIEEA